MISLIASVASFSMLATGITALGETLSCVEMRWNFGDSKPLSVRFYLNKLTHLQALDVVCHTKTFQKDFICQHWPYAD